MEFMVNLYPPLFIPSNPLAHLPLYDQAREVKRERERMSSVFFADPFRRFLSPAVLRRSGYPAADWTESSSAHIIRVDVPGFGKEDIKVHLEEGNVLHVKGQPSSSASAAEKDALWHVAERVEKEAFSRRFELPDGIKADQIRAQVENGVLTVVAPKEAAPAKPKPRAIPVSSKL